MPKTNINAQENTLENANNAKGKLDHDNENAKTSQQKMNRAHQQGDAHEQQKEEHVVRITVAPREYDEFFFTFGDRFKHQFFFDPVERRLLGIFVRFALFAPNLIIDYFLAIFGL